MLQWTLGGKGRNDWSRPCPQEVYDLVRRQDKGTYDFKTAQSGLHAAGLMQGIHSAASHNRCHFWLGTGEKFHGSGDIRSDPSRRERI